MGKQDDLVKAYIRALEVKALMVLAVQGHRPCRLASEPVKNLDIFDALYFAKTQYAELVLSHVRDDLASIGALRPEGWIDMEARELRDTIANVAGYLGARFRSFAEVQRDAENAVADILENVERARIKGDLRRVNAEYKAYRQRQLAAGQKAIGYTEHVTNFTLSLVILAAKNANAVGLRKADSFAE